MSLFVTVALAFLALSVFILVGVGFLYKKGEINETPGDLQFANLKNIPGEDYVDLNVVKVGKTKTLFSYSNVGSIRWVDFYYPTTLDHIEKRSMAVKMILVMYSIFGLMGLIMWVVDLAIGLYFMYFMMGAVALVTVLKFIEIVVLGRR
jgi:hypothetical protein